MHARVAAHRLPKQPFKTEGEKGENSCWTVQKDEREKRGSQILDRKKSVWWFRLAKKG